MRTNSPRSEVKDVLEDRRIVAEAGRRGFPPQEGHASPVIADQLLQAGEAAVGDQRRRRR